MEMGEILDSFFLINSEEVTYKTKHNNTKKNKENNTHRCRQCLPEIWHKVIQLKLQGVGGPHDNSSIQGHGTKGIVIVCLVREPSRSLGWKISRNPQTPVLSWHRSRLL